MYLIIEWDWVGFKKNVKDMKNSFVIKIYLYFKIIYNLNNYKTLCK